MLTARTVSSYTFLHEGGKTKCQNKMDGESLFPGCHELNHPQAIKDVDEFVSSLEQI